MWHPLLLEISHPRRRKPLIKISRYNSSIRQHSVIWLMTLMIPTLTPCTDIPHSSLVKRKRMFASDVTWSPPFALREHMGLLTRDSPEIDSFAWWTCARATRFRCAAESSAYRNREGVSSGRRAVAAASGRPASAVSAVARRHSYASRPRAPSILSILRISRQICVCVCIYMCDVHCCGIPPRECPRGVNARLRKSKYDFSLTLNVMLVHEHAVDWSFSSFLCLEDKSPRCAHRVTHAVIQSGLRALSSIRLIASCPDHEIWKWAR